MQSCLKGDFVALKSMSNEQFDHHLARVDRLREDGRMILELHPELGFEDVSASGTTTAIAVPVHRLRRAFIPTPGQQVSSWDGHSREMIRSITGPRGLPDELADSIAEFLSLRAVSCGDVHVVRASSSRGDYPLSAVLASNDEWWISAPLSMPEGQGNEWLEVSFGTDGSSTRRISAIGVRIPPLPAGPLSVRQFFLQTCRNVDGERVWEKYCSLVLQTLDRPEMQWLSLVPPIESSAVRVVMTTNAANACVVEQPVSRSFHCVGLFQLAFA